MSEEEDRGGREAPRFPHIWRNVAIFIVALICVYAAYTVIGNELSAGLPYPKSVAVAGSANLPAIDLIPKQVYFMNNTGHVFYAVVSTNAHYSVILPNKAAYNVSILYQNVVGGGRDTCNAGVFNLASHSNATSYNPSCASSP